MHIYLDESGDLGFSKRASRYFVAGFVIPYDRLMLETTMKRILKRLHETGRYAKEASELKFGDSSPYVRAKVLQELAAKEVDIGCIILRKDKTKESLRDKKNILYNYTVVHHLISNVLPSYDPQDELQIMIDKSLSREARKAFDSYLSDKISWIWKAVLHRSETLDQTRMRVSHVDSGSCPCIQAADFVAGATRRKYESGDGRYYEVMASKIKYFIMPW